jgi:hypothetical protein
MQHTRNQGGLILFDTTAPSSSMRGALLLLKAVPRKEGKTRVITHYITRYDCPLKISPYDPKEEDPLTHLGQKNIADASIQLQGREKQTGATTITILTGNTAHFNTLAFQY